VQRVEHLDSLAREPMIVEHPDGSLFLAGYGQPHPQLWKSLDRGATWMRLYLGNEAAGATGNSDVDLAVAADGTLYFVVMSYDRKTNEGTGMAVGTSTDSGTRWRWTSLSKARFDDRPWIEAAPDGSAHVIWNDGSGVWHAVSRDRGVTWTRTGRVHDKGGSSHMAIGTQGEIAVRVTPSSASANRFDRDVDLIAISSDGGTTWTTHPAPGVRDWNAPDEKEITPRWVEPLAWDADGALYSAWCDKDGLELARSSDRGVTWQTWLPVASPARTFFPYLISRGHGRLAASWFSAASDDLSDLRWHVAAIDLTGSPSSPKVDQSAPQSLESAVPDPEHGNALLNDAGGEYIALTTLRDGSLAAATVIQHKEAGRLGFTWWRFRIAE
jgi:hypothetical protein